MKRYDQCDDTCTTDCGHCKGAGRPTPELSPAEAAIVAKFDAAEPAPESYVKQHRMEHDCWCGVYPVGTLGVLTHQMVEP